MKINTKTFNVLLAKRQLSITDLAEKSGISKTTLHNIKNGAYAIPKTVGKISEALNVDVTELIED